MTTYKYFNATTDKRPLIWIEDGKTIIADSHKAVVLPYEEGTATVPGTPLNIKDMTKYCGTPLALPDVKTIKAEIKARGIRRTTKRGEQRTYLLMKDVAVDIYDLLDVVTICGTSGQWTGKYRYSKEHVVNVGPIAVGEQNYGNNYGCIMSCNIPEGWTGYAYTVKPTESAQAKAIKSFLTYNEASAYWRMENDNMYITNGYAVVKLAEEVSPDVGVKYTGSLEKLFNLPSQYTEALGEYTYRTVTDRLVFDEFDIDGKLFRRIIRICGSGILYWSEKVYHQSDFVWTDALYFMGEYGEAVIMPIKKRV